MVKLRLKRIGKRKQPYYRIVAIHDSVARNGRAIAEVGLYDPMHASVKIDEERAIEWLNKGAQMTETVADLFHSQGVLARWKGAEGRVRDDALSGDKPKSRRKKAAAPVQPAEPVEQKEAAPVEQVAAEPEAAAPDEQVAAESAESAEQEATESAEPVEPEAAAPAEQAAAESAEPAEQEEK